jgi:uncharacterized membrane protein (DUF485 family)
VAGDRLITIAFPLRYPNIVRRKRVICIQTAFLALSVVCAFLPLVGFNQWDNAIGCFPLYVLPMAYSISAGSILGGFLFITFGIYVNIFLVAKTHFERIIREEALRNTRGHKPCLTDLKAAKMLLLIAAIFVTCWGTNYVILGAIDLGNIGIAYILESFGHCLILLPSVLNPIVYTFRNPELRWAFCKLLRHRSTDTSGSETRETAVTPS